MRPVETKKKTVETKKRPVETKKDQLRPKVKIFRNLARSLGISKRIAIQRCFLSVLCVFAAMPREGLRKRMCDIAISSLGCLSLGMGPANKLEIFRASRGVRSMTQAFRFDGPVDL